MQCALASSQLNDILWVSVDHNGAVVGIVQSVSGNRATCDQDAPIDLDALEEFNTDVFIKPSEVGRVYVPSNEAPPNLSLSHPLSLISRPDTATFIQKIEREREARDRGEVKDNRGFFAKYWMYIVPVAILVLVSGITNPEPAANANGGASR